MCIRKLFLLGALSGGVVASAVPITYTFNLVASGTIGSTSFNDQTITFVATTDTAFITGTPPNQSSAQITGVTVTIGGVGTGTLTASAAIYGGLTFVQLVSGSGRIVVQNPGTIPFNYDLRTPLGPAKADLTEGTTTLQTTLGTLNLNGGEPTFTATLSPPPGVPIPSTFLLTLVGLAALTVWHHRWQPRQSRAPGRF